MNPFLSENIIKTLGKSCSRDEDKETLMKLRQVSTPYHNILNKLYFDLLQIKIILYVYKNELNCCFPNGFKRKLNLQDWNPIFAKTIRVLEFHQDPDCTYGSNYCDINPPSTQNWTMYHLLLNQIFPYITTLKLMYIPDGLDTTKLLKFIQQFVNLKNISFRNLEFPKFAFTDIKSVLSSLKSSGIIVELMLDDYYVKGMKRILAPETGIKSSINRIGFRDPYIPRESTFQRFADLVQENQSIISDIELWINFGDHEFQVDNHENVLKNFRVISPFVSYFYCEDFNIEPDLLFNTVYWPNLMTLKLCEYYMPLPNLCNSCPKLRELEFYSCNREDVFYNIGTTEQDLEHSFRGCEKSLKKLTFSYQITPNSNLHKYLEKLLPNTKIVLDMGGET